MSDDVQKDQDKSKKPKYITTTIQVPTPMNNKLEYIKRRTFLSKQKIILKSCSMAIDSWFQALMEQEAKNAMIKTTLDPMGVPQGLGPMPEPIGTIGGKLPVPMVGPTFTGPGLFDKKRGG